MARYVWGVATCAFSVNMNLSSVSELCVWVMKFPGKIRGVVVVGVTVVIWLTWKCRNNACFRNVFPYEPSSVVTQISY